LRQIAAQLEVEEFDEIDDKHHEILTCQSYLAAERPVEEWDCESIISTYSTLDNHPSIIKVYFLLFLISCDAFPNTLCVCFTEYLLFSYVTIIITYRVVIILIIYVITNKSNHIHIRTPLHRNLDRINRNSSEQLRLKLQFMPKDHPSSRKPDLMQARLLLLHLTVSVDTNH
jgi:hypothetical protein